jgi:hypothetical protein
LIQVLFNSRHFIRVISSILPRIIARFTPRL